MKRKVIPYARQSLSNEDINKVGSRYFSGTLDPFKRAARFTVYKDFIKVRANWSNTINQCIGKCF